MFSCNGNVGMPMGGFAENWRTITSTEFCYRVRYGAQIPPLVRETAESLDKGVATKRDHQVSHKLRQANQSTLARIKCPFP